MYDVKKNHSQPKRHLKCLLKGTFAGYGAAGSAKDGSAEHGIVSFARISAFLTLPERYNRSTFVKYIKAFANIECGNDCRWKLLPIFPAAVMPHALHDASGCSCGCTIPSVDKPCERSRSASRKYFCFSSSTANKAKLFVSHWIFSLKFLACSPSEPRKSYNLAS
jgi:hypothetical protein